MLDLEAANALPQCFHTFKLEVSSVSIKENSICMHNNKELKRAVPMYNSIIEFIEKDTTKIEKSTK